MKSSVLRGDCYAAGERGFMNWWQRARASSLSGLLNWLSCRGVTANGVTWLSLLVGLAFWPLISVSPLLALAALFLHLVLDGLDGPLARQQGSDSRSGSFTDTAVDQLVVTFTTLALIQHSIIGVTVGLIYTFIYGVVVGFAMVRNALGVPYTWLIRPRLLVYVWMLMEFYVWPGTLDAVLWICVALLATKAISGFLRIRRAL